MASGPQPGVIYYIDDHLGSSHLVTDSEGTVLCEERRYPYGLERSSQPEPQSESAVAVDYVYTGKEYDVETGLIYFGGRYYAPELGRWITPDPLFLEKEPAKIVEMPKELNLYAYVQNNPMTLTDEKGKYGARSRDLYMNSQALREEMRTNALLAPISYEEDMFRDGLMTAATAGFGVGFVAKDGSADFEIPACVPGIGGDMMSFSNSGSIGPLSVSTTGDASLGLASLGYSVDMTIASPNMKQYGHVSFGLGEHLGVSIIIGLDSDGAPTVGFQGSAGPGIGLPVTAGITNEGLEELQSLVERIGE